MLETIERGFFTSAIKLSDIKAGMPAAQNPDVQILRVGSFNHPKYGEFDITSAKLAEMKANFDAGIRGIDIALDYFHNSDQEASGWLKDLYLSEDGNELWGKVDWTPKASKMLAEREIRYFSPDFAFEWVDPETEITYENVLFGGGLTNRPFVKDMAAIVASEKTKGDKMTLSEIEKKLVKLSEDSGDLAKKHADLMQAHSDLQAKHGALEKKMAEMGPPKPAKPDPKSEPEDEPDGDEEMSPEDTKAALSEAKKKLAEYAEKEKKSVADAQLAEKKSAFKLMLAEGKACVAQEAAYIKGDLITFMKLAQPLNTTGKGSAGGAGEGGDTRDDRVMKLAEEKQKADPKLSKIDAITLANKEVKA